jgi:hypothetical protein
LRTGASYRWISSRPEIHEKSSALTPIIAAKADPDAFRQREQ